MKKQKYNVVISNFTTDVNKGATKDDINQKVPLYKAHKEGCECAKCQVKEKHANTWSNTQVTKKELAEKLITGHYFTPVELEDKNHLKESFISSEVIAFDFDNGDEPTDVLNAFEEMNIGIAIGYTSASDKPEKRKFRMITFLDGKVWDYEEYEQILYGIYDKLKKNYGIKADSNTLDATHAFYPGKELILVDELAVTSLDVAESFKADIEPIRAEIKAERKAEKEEKEKARAKKMGVSLEEMYLIEGKIKKAEKAKKQAQREEDIKSGKITKEQAKKIARTESNELVEAIKSKDIEKCKTILMPKYKHINEDDWSMMTLDEKEAVVPMTDFFDVTTEEQFLCWLPAHSHDSSPSAQVNISYNGEEVYNCYGCKSVHQLHTVVGLMLGYDTRNTAQFLTEVTGKQWLSNYQLNSIVEANNLERIVNGKNFEHMYPNLYKFLNTRASLSSLYLFLVRQASLLVLDKPLTNSTDKITFFMSFSEMQRRAKNYNLTGMSCPKEVGKKIKNLCKRGLLISEDDMKEEVMNKAKSLKALNNRRYHTGFYTINLSSDVFAEAEKITIELKEKGDRNSFTSKLQTIATMGEEKAQELYKQDDISKMNYTKMRNKFIEITSEIISNQGYATKEQIIELYASKIGGKASLKQCEKRFERYKGFLTNKDYFEYIRVNKAVRSEYSVSEAISSNAKIFVAI